MRKLDREGYSACDIRPDGGFVAVTEPRDRHVLTHLGTLVCPDVPHWPRITPVGPVKIAVQGERRTREWVGGQDWLIHREACGAPGPVIYDRTGQLRISDCSGAGEGYHHVAPDGRLVWGNEVSTRFGSELRETTDLGDGLFVGQGQWGGAWVQLPDGYRLIGAGVAMVLRASRVGDDVAICWYEPTPGSAIAHFRWYTLDELRALPSVATTWHDEPPCEVPEFLVPDHPITVHIFGGPGFRMNLGPGHDRDPHAAPSGAFVTIDHDDEAAFQRQAAYARQHGVPLFQYIDKGARWRPEMLRRVDGVRCVAAVRCYPTGTIVDIWSDIIALAKAEVETAIVLAGYRQMKGYGPEMNWTLEQVFSYAASTWNACQHIATVRHALLFHQRRQATPPGASIVNLDGLDSRPELQLMADRIRAAAAAAPVAPPLPPQPPQDNTPDTDTPAPPVVAPPAPEEPMPPYTELSHYLDPGWSLMLGEHLISVDGAMELWLHEDGNLVLYRRQGEGLEVAWSPWIGKRGVRSIVMQTGGRMVALGASGEECWATDGPLAAGPQLIVRGAPHFDVVVARDGIVTWQRPTEAEKPKPKPKPSPRPSSGGFNVLDAIRSWWNSRKKTQAPVPNPSVPPAPVEPPVVEVPAPPAIVLPPLRHRSIEEVRAIVMSGRHAYLLRQHHPEAFMDAVLAEVDDPRWGLHLRPNGRHGGGVIAFNVPEPPGGAPYRIFDIVAGATSPSPAPGWLDQTATMEPGSRFDPLRRDQVPPVLTLPRVRVDGLRFVTDRGVFDWRGGTAFDLPSRIRILGDLRYADWMAETGFTLARVVPASRFRTQRTLADGVRDLPRALAELAVRGLYAEVVIGVDTGQYGMSREDMRIYTRDMLDICREYSNTLVEVGNELSHGTQAAFLRDAAFLAELVAMCREAGVTCSAGSSHGGEGLLWTGGDFATHHADRSVAPEVNVAAMADLQDMHDLPVVDDEPLGTHEIAQPGRRTNDPGYAEVQARAARTQGLAGTTFHCEAGLTANVDVLGPVQREAARRFIAELRAW